MYQFFCPIMGSQISFLGVNFSTMFSSQLGWYIATRYLHLRLNIDRWPALLLYDWNQLIWKKSPNDASPISKNNNYYRCLRSVRLLLVYRHCFIWELLLFDICMSFGLILLNFHKTWKFSRSLNLIKSVTLKQYSRNVSCRTVPGSIHSV